MLKKIGLIFCTLFVFASFALPASAQLKTNPTDPGTEKKDGGLTTAFSSIFNTNTESLDQSLAAQAGRVIQLFVSFAGVIMLIFIVYAGLLWMTAGGNESQIGKAKSIMTNAIIGLIIVLLAFALVAFINAQIAASGLAK